jgi:hypothetical protein
MYGLWEPAPTGLSEPSGSEPRASPSHHQFGLNLEAVLFGSLHGRVHGPKDRFGRIRVMPTCPQRPKTDSL